jgi:membrane-associated phospholipid phosphatase
MKQAKTTVHNDDRNQKDSSTSRSVLIIQVVYVLGLSLWSMLQGIFPSPEWLFILLLLLGYQALRGFADNLSPADINIENLIEWERTLFNGIIPAAYLQATLMNKPYTMVLNVITNVLYMSHFVVPVIMALILWYRKKDRYWPFVSGLIILSYAGFITYLLFPAAPPWWATYYGYLPEEAVVMPLTDIVLPTVAVFAGPNPVAAMPSLHAAYPTYIALYCLVTWGKKSIWMFLLPLGICFSTVYLGHHYVIDLLAGILYALVVFAIILWWFGNKDYSVKYDVPKSIGRT